MLCLDYEYLATASHLSPTLRLYSAQEPGFPNVKSTGSIVVAAPQLAAAAGISAVDMTASVVVAAQHSGPATLMLYDREAPHELVWSAAQGGPMGIHCLQADDQLLASGTLGGAVDLFHFGLAPSDGLRHVFHWSAPGSLAQVLALQFDACYDQLAVACNTGLVHLLAPGTGQHLADLRGHIGSVDAIQVDDALSLISTAGADGVVRLWDRRSQRLVSRLRSNVPGQIVRTQFDSFKLVAVGGGEADHVISWDLRTLAPQAIYQHHARIYDMKFDSKRCVLACGEHGVAWLNFDMPVTSRTASCLDYFPRL